MEQFTRLAHSSSKVAGHLEKSRENEIPERMARETVRILEAMFTNGRQDGPLRRKGNHAFPDIAHCRHVERFTESTCRATAVGHSYDRGDVDELFLFGQFFQSTQEDREASTTAYPYDSQCCAL